MMYIINYEVLRIRLRLNYAGQFTSSFSFDFLNLRVEYTSCLTNYCIHSSINSVIDEVNMTEWSVTYARKQGNIWKKGTTKATLWFQGTAGSGDLVVYFKERCLV